MKKAGIIRFLSLTLACLAALSALFSHAMAASQTVTASQSDNIRLTVSNTTPKVGETVTIRFQNMHFQDSMLIPYTYNYWCTMPEKYEIYLNGELYYTVDLKANYDRNPQQSYITLKNREYSCSFTFTEPVTVTMKSVYCKTVYYSVTGILLENSYGYQSNVVEYTAGPIQVTEARFSVTVPDSLPIAMDENGQITTAANAAIVNNSSYAVKISGLTVNAENGWSLVPFNHSMAGEKVDSRLVGFSINNAKTSKSGISEVLPLVAGWTIAKNSSLALNYNAVISAVSEPVSGQKMMNLVFVVEWA